MPEGDPVSWLVLEKGWKVVAADGSEVGTVGETIGDSSHDIFDGITVRTGLLEKPRYVPAEQIGRITDGEIQLNLSSDQAAELKAYDEPPPTEEVLPEGGSWWTRLLDSFRRRRA
jgi:hypothetical protein